LGVVFASIPARGYSVDFGALLATTQAAGVATRCVLRDYAKQYLQWITHGTFEKRTVQSQILLGYLQLNGSMILGSVWNPAAAKALK
jgi:hypothetical protein